MTTAFQIFFLIAGILSLFASFGNNTEAAERAFKTFCAVGAMIIGILLVAAVSK